MIKRDGDKGSPWRTSRLTWNDLVKKPLLTTQLTCYIIVKCPDPCYEGRTKAKSFKRFKKKLQSKRVECLFKIDGRHYAFTSLHFRIKSMTSLIVLTASKIVRPFTNAFWSRCIIYGRTFSNFFAIAFEPIFTSTFTREIGLQFFYQSSVSILFLY